MKRKIITLLLATAVSATTIMGCGTEEPAEETIEATTETVEETTVEETTEAVEELTVDEVVSEMLKNYAAAPYVKQNLTGSYTQIQFFNRESGLYYSEYHATGYDQILTVDLNTKTYYVQSPDDTEMYLKDTEDELNDMIINVMYQEYINEYNPKLAEVINDRYVVTTDHDFTYYIDKNTMTLVELHTSEGSDVTYTYPEKGSAEAEEIDATFVIPDAEHIYQEGHNLLVNKNKTE